MALEAEQKVEGLETTVNVLTKQLGDMNTKVTEMEKALESFGLRKNGKWIGDPDFNN